TVDYVKSEVVQERETLYVTHACLEDSTTPPNSIAFGKLVGTNFTCLEEEPNPAVGVTYHTEKTHHFITGEEPCFRVEGAVLADILRGHLEGYKAAI
ncbi:unnamed protein product, partial [marine sediment metagenome]